MDARDYMAEFENEIEEEILAEYSTDQTDIDPEIVPEVDFSDFDDFDDFDLQEADYEVWLIGYDENESITDFENMLFSGKDLENVIAFAKMVYDNPEDYLGYGSLPENVKYISIEVETIVDVDEIPTNVQTVYRRRIELVDSSDENN